MDGKSGANDDVDSAADDADDGDEISIRLVVVDVVVVVVVLALGVRDYLLGMFVSVGWRNAAKLRARRAELSWPPLLALLVSELEKIRVRELVVCVCVYVNANVKKRK